MGDSDLNINDVSRFTKRSNLILEEFSHCEVPAGCGGVVMRWRNAELIPLRIHVHATGELETFLDGERPTSSRPLLKPGRHVLAFILREPKSSGFIAFAGLSIPDADPNVRLSDSRTQPIRVISADDGTWRHSTTEPLDESWKRAGFNDAEWTALVKQAIPPPEPTDIGSYQLKKLKELGATSLGVQGSTGGILQLLLRRKAGNVSLPSIVWIRKEFDISP